MKIIVDDEKSFKIIGKANGFNDDELDKLIPFIKSADQAIFTANDPAKDANSATTQDAEESIFRSSTPPDYYPSKLKDKWLRGPPTEKNIAKRKALHYCYLEFQWTKNQMNKYSFEWKTRLKFENQIKILNESLTVKLVVFLYCEFALYYALCLYIQVNCIKTATMHNIEEFIASISVHNRGREMWKLAADHFEALRRIRHVADIY